MADKVIIRITGDKQCQQQAGNAADDTVYGRQPYIKAPVIRSIFEPLNLLAFVLGALFAHFILGPLIFA